MKTVNWKIVWPVGFAVTLIWLAISFYSIEGLHIKAKVNPGSLSALITTTEIDVPVHSKNLKIILGKIGIPLYLNMIFFCLMVISYITAKNHPPQPQKNEKMP